MNSKMLARLALVASLALAAACSDDDDDDGASGAEACAHAQRVCDEEQDDGSTVTIECENVDEAPASARNCISEAEDCGEVLACLLAAS
jgi:hypothetical protein